MNPLPSFRLLLALLVPASALGAAATPTPAAMSISKSASPALGLLAGDTVQICIDVSSPQPKADILWVIDVSTSMDVGINNIIANILTFTAQLSTKGLDYQNDLFIYTGDFSGWLYFDYGWTSDDSVFAANLSDAAASTYSGIEWTLEALQFSKDFVTWRAGASKTMVLITDEGIPCLERAYVYPGPYGPATQTLTGTAAALIADDITLHSISKPWPWDTDPEHRCDPQDLPGLTGGLWLDYNTPASGWDTLLDQMGAAIQGNSNLVISDPVPAQLDPIPSSISGGTLSGQTVSWTVSAAAQGAAFQFCFEALVNAPWWGPITNTANLTGDGLPVLLSNPVPLVYATPTMTPSFTNSPTSTHTPTMTATPTATRTHSPTASETATPTATRTHSPTASETATPTATRTHSPTASGTFTPTPTRSATSTETPTYTRSATPTPTPTATPTATQSATPTPSPTATPSFTDTPTYTATPSVTETFSFSPTSTITPTSTATPIAEPWRISIALYNSAGELVRHLFEGSSQTPAISLELQSQPGDPDPIGMLVGGLATRYQTVPRGWDGRNNAGQAVADGTYVFKVESKDSFNRVSTLIQSATLFRDHTLNELEIYNSAGERVATLALPSGTSALDASGPLVLASQGGAPGAEVRFLAQGPGPAGLVSWNGLNSQGQAVGAGSYVVKWMREQPGLRSEIKAWGVQVLRAGDLGAEALLAGLRPRENPSALRGGRLTLEFPAAAGLEVRALLYNLAGEKVGEAGASSLAGQLGFSTAGLSAGIYVASLEARRQGSLEAARRLKVVLLP